MSGRSAHVLDYDGIDQRIECAPPELDGIDTITRYQYNRDRELTAIERPDGTQVTLTYDTGGRLATRTTDAGTATYGYDANTGQLTSIEAPGGIGLKAEWDGFLPTAAEWTGPVSGRITWTYDNNFWVTQETVGGVCQRR